VSASEVAGGVEVPPVEIEAVKWPLKLREKVRVLRDPDRHGAYAGRTGSIASNELGGVVFVHLGTTYANFRTSDLERIQGDTMSDRSTILATASDLISGQRAKDYGDAADNFQRLADLWQPVLGVSVTPEQVALCLTQLKVSRLITSPNHQDSWIDACGYLALGGEIAGRKK